MSAVLWLCVGVPLAGALATRLASRRSGLAGALAAAASAVPAWVLLAAAATGERDAVTFTWLPAGDGLEAGLRLDGLSAAMAATVATVGLVVAVHAAGYFAGEPRAASAQAGLLAFLAAMQGLVLADGYLTLLVFWEIVGALSARLIAFSRDDPAAAPAAVRAFLTTRAADLGLYLAVLALFAGTGALAFGAERPDGVLGALVGAGLVVAAMGKSAQAPLQAWLAGAMAGPTPVSALLHSATMVAAGVYLLIRSHDLLAGWPLALAGWVGAATAVAGAAIALAQDDLKRVLAGSTTSQLGLMFVGAAAGGPAVALFHVVAHAAGKAGLFLTAGILQHRHGSTSLAVLAGAGRADRRTFAAFAVCALSIAAVPPLAAFWSKDAIVVASEDHVGWLLLVLVASAGAAAYLLRPALVLWRGPAAAGGRPVAGRRPMLAAAGALAGASVLLGLAGGPLAGLIGGTLPRPTLPGVLLSLGAAAVGAGAVLGPVRAPRGLRASARRQLGAPAFLRAIVVVPACAAGRLAAAFDDRAVDAAVDATGRGARALARAVAAADGRGLDAAVDAAGAGAVGLARAQRRVEDRGLDAAVDGLARLVGRAGSDSTRLQTGRLYEYLRGTVAGIAALALLVTLTALI